MCVCVDISKIIRFVIKLRVKWSKIINYRYPKMNTSNIIYYRTFKKEITKSI